MKRIFIFTVSLWIGLAWTLQAPHASSQEAPPPQSPSGTSQPAVPPPELSPVAQQIQPDRYAVAFLPLDKGDKSVAFLVTPDGKVGTLPMSNLTDAFKAGYRPFTVADLLAITNAVADEERNSQRKIKELSEDYDSLAARYNRLAEVNSAPSAQPQQAYDERRMMRAMVFQSMLQRAFPAPAVQIQMRTIDCTKLPALCVGR